MGKYAAGMRPYSFDGDLKIQKLNRYFRKLAWLVPYTFSQEQMRAWKASK